jgi:hypothetical protein
MKKKVVNPNLPAPYGQMSAEELDAEVAKFDRQFIADESKPLTPEMVAAWQRAMRKLGRPRVGAGVKVVAVSIEKSLLRRTDAMAKKQKISRAALIARALETILGKAG